MSEAGQLILGCIEAKELSKNERDFLIKTPTSGVTLFARNLGHSTEIRLLINQLQALAPTAAPFFVAVDQEGGRVARLKAPFPDLGPAMQIADGQSDDQALAQIRAYGSQVGDGLAQLGFNVNWAPTVDVLSEPDNHCIGDRSWAADAKTASLRAGAFLAGLEENKQVLGCLKHFPGQGHGLIDTHLGPCLIESSLETLENRELVPFRDLAAKARLIMTSHCVFPSWDDQPASLSSKICSDLLRTKLDFRGLLVSDDLTMHAIAQDDQTWAEAVVTAIAAGCDLVLVCRGLERWKLAVESLERESCRSPSFAKRVETAAQAVLRQRSALSKITVKPRGVSLGM